MSKEIEDNKQFLNACDLSLDEWLKVVVTPVDSRDYLLYPDYCFPTDAYKNEYLDSIAERDKNQIKSLLRVFLLPTAQLLGADKDRISRFIEEDCNKALEYEQVCRVLRREPAWEGITWIIDLLHRPRMAIDVIRAYLAAHFWWLPDWRINGLFDAIALIRAAYLNPLSPREELLCISPRDFELIVAMMFHRRDYKVCVTRVSHDGGFDIKLHCATSGKVESSVVECKRYTNNVGVKELRAILGVVERDNVTRGLIVTTAGFTRSAISEASKTNRIELIDYDTLCVLFNEHFGPKWPRNIDSLILEAQRKFVKQSRRVNNDT